MRLTVRVFLEPLSVCANTSFSFGFETGMWDLIILISDDCLSLYSTRSATIFKIRNVLQIRLVKILKSR